MAAPRDARQAYYLQFVSAPTADTPGTMAMLHFDSKRYMFGRMAEGTQRACVQRGAGLKKVRNVFLTGTSTWKDNGGLVGFMLTLSDQQLQETEAAGSGLRPRLNIHGAPKLLHSVACARRFVFRTGVPLAIHESTGKPFHWPSEPSFVDENIRVWPIALADHQSSSTFDGAADDIARQVEAEQAIRQKIVSDMFDSEWRRDRLVEIPFNKVTMPATVWVRDPETKDLQHFVCTNMDDAPQIKPDQIVLVRNPWPASLVGHLPLASNLPSGIAMSYIVRGHRQRGSFDRNKAKELGVPFGPIRKGLTIGESITLEDGRVITPDMVLAPGREGKGIAFFDLPTLAHLRNLQALLGSNLGMLDNVALAVWTLGQGVGSSQEFKDTLLPLSTLDHISSDPDNTPNILAFESAGASSIRLSDVSSTLFPVPVYNVNTPFEHTDTPLQPERNTQPDAARNLPLPVSFGAVKPGLKVIIEPRYSQDESGIPLPMTLDSAEKAVSSEYIAAKKALGEDPIPPSTSLNEPEIITLGTGSALPSKYRNVSATLLRMPGGQGNYLFDCGENTMGQLRRMYSYSELQDILINLKSIWISHLHADHHLGTITVLQGRAAAFDKHAPEADRTIYLMSEPNKIDFIRDYSSVEPSLTQNTGLVPIVCVEGLGPTIDGEVFDFPSHGSAIARVGTVRVSHCWGAQAITMTFKSGFKISYSGDCRPSGKFCRLGHDSDVLIHEATFDDGMEGDAMAKKHSTTSEALGVALRMRAKNVILTHFSQRYQKVPNLENVKLPEDIRYEEGDNSGEAGPVDEAAAEPRDEGSTMKEGIVLDEIMDRQNAMSLGNEFLDAKSVSTSTASVAQSVDKDQALLASLSATREAKRADRESSAAQKLSVCVAFDCMRVRVSQIKECKKVYPAIQAMFNEMDQKSDDRRAVEREKMETQANAKRNKKGKWQAEQGSGKKKAKIDTENGERSQKPEVKMNAKGTNDTSGQSIDAASIKGQQSADVKAAPELVGAEDWWEQITPTPKVAAAEGWWDSLITTENNDTEAVNVDELASTSHGTGGAATSLEASQSETSRRQLKRQAARERKRVTKKAKLDNEEGTTSQQPLGDDQPSSPSSTVEAPTVPGEDPDVSAQQISPSSPPPSKSMQQLKRETKKERPQDLAKRREIQDDSQLDQDLKNVFLEVHRRSKDVLMPEGQNTTKRSRRVLRRRIDRLEGARNLDFITQQEFEDQMVKLKTFLRPVQTVEGPLSGNRDAAPLDRNIANLARQLRVKREARITMKRELRRKQDEAKPADNAAAGARHDAALHLDSTAASSSSPPSDLPPPPKPTTEANPHPNPNTNTTTTTTDTRLRPTLVAPNKHPFKRHKTNKLKRLADLAAREERATHARQQQLSPPK